ncbi:MAG: hypothetical protein MJB14_15900 [Spirochaetes bacterium]|nr:hypothetical protein [Spirochaetota bacterium]
MIRISDSCLNDQSIEKSSQYAAQLLREDIELAIAGEDIDKGIKFFLDVKSELIKPEAFRIKKSKQGKNTLVILEGGNICGLYYAVHAFSEKILKLDPLRYWLETPLPKKKRWQELDLLEFTQAAPLVPIRCYFDNDNDELANLEEPKLEIPFKRWQQILITLSRLKFNAIDFHDHLGRPEYTERAEYLTIRNDYHVNEKLLNQIIDFAHLLGMKVQVSFYLGWEFQSITNQEALCWTKHKDRWLSTWQYYLQNTPIGKCDIFLNRPRNQKWDYPYQSSCGETVAEVFNEVFPIMAEIIKKHNPAAIIIADLYSEGRTAYEKGFRPQPAGNFIMCWPDDGFGNILYWPELDSEYDWGIYIHAGFWLNHVVQDPYPHKLENVMKKAFLEKGMTRYCLVNGQTFRHFLLNLETCARLCDQPDKFQGESFIHEWCNRYFSQAGNKVVSLLKMLHDSQDGNVGYVEYLWYIKNEMLRLQNEFYQEVTTESQKRINILYRALSLAEIVEKDISTQSKIIFYDQVYFPLILLTNIIEICSILEQTGNKLDYQTGLLKAARLTDQHTALREQGDLSEKWKGWYTLKNRRPNNGYPDSRHMRQLAIKMKQNLNSC